MNDETARARGAWGPATLRDQSLKLCDFEAMSKPIIPPSWFFEVGRAASGLLAAAREIERLQDKIKELEEGRGHEFQAG